MLADCVLEDCQASPLASPHREGIFLMPYLPDKPSSSERYLHIKTPGQARGTEKRNSERLSKCVALRYLFLSGKISTESSGEILGRERETCLAVSAFSALSLTVPPVVSPRLKIFSFLRYWYLLRLVNYLCVRMICERTCEGTCERNLWKDLWKEFVKESCDLFLGSLLKDLWRSVRILRNNLHRNL